MATTYAERLQTLLAEKRFAEISPMLDAVELELGGVLPAGWPSSVHLLGHLVNNLDNARFFYKRLPDGAKQGDAELAAAWALTQALWVRDYPSIQTAFSSFPWSTAAAPVAACLAEKHTQSMIELLGRAYTTLSATDAAAFLGVPMPEALNIAQQAGWGYDAASGLLQPRSQPPPPKVMPGVDHLQSLVEYAVHLG